MKFSHCVAMGIVAVFLMTAFSAAHAKLYRYQDASGNWCYTDNFADVPLDQREDCKQYESIQSPAAKPIHADRAKAADGKNAPEDPGQLRDKLLARKAALDHEYQTLVEESGKLEKQSLNLKADEDLKAFENRKKTFTQRLKVFEDRRQVFEKDLQAYNDIVGHQKN